MQPTAIREYAEAADKTNHQDMEKMYFHLVKADPPPPIGAPRDPAAGARVWSAEDWFALPADTLFASYAGDFQPRDVDGDPLGTADRLAIQAIWGERQSSANGNWGEAPDPRGPGVEWIRSGTESAIPVVESRETPEETAMRNLPGKDGYGPSRGTEHIDRPDNERRAEALGVLVHELAEGNGIDVVREGPADSTLRRLPTVLAHEDGGIEVRLGGLQFDRPSTVDLIEETTAVAVAIAWRHEYNAGKRPAPQLDRAMVAGVIAGHEMVQSAGIRCPMAPDYSEHVSRWARTQRESETPGQMREEAGAVIRLATAAEWRMRVPTTPRDRARWERMRKERGPGTEPVPVTNRSDSGKPAAEPQRLAAGQGAPARPKISEPAGTAGRTAPARTPATNAPAR